MNLSYTKQLEIKYDIDVFIAGGGPAGVAAGVAAARQGNSVFIAESFSAFGGAAVTMLVPAFMQFGDGEHFLSAGIGSEVFNYLKENSFESFRKYCPTSIPVETLKICYDDMVKDSGANFLFHTNVIDVIADNGKIECVICAAKGEMFAVKAKVYVDCTGDGDLSYYAGAEYEYGNEDGDVMATTLCSIWTGMDWSQVNEGGGAHLDEAFAAKIFTNEDRHIPGIWRIADGVGGSNVGHVYDINGTKAEDLTKGIMFGRKQLNEYRRYYREYLKGYENTEIVYSASYLGIRESRRIMCDYKLVLNDFIEKSDFDDEIGRYCYNIDIHSPKNNTAGYKEFAREHSTYRYKKGENYGIPYRTLTVKNFDNLLVAGRCISTDRYMQSSVRVMPGCYITGQAAGIAAAVSASANQSVHSIDVHEVQKRLVKLGAYLPNYKE